MALTELTALEDAYKALQPLGQAAQRRALQWLTDALIPGDVLPDTPARPNTTAPEATMPATETVTVAESVPVIPPRPARGRKAATAAHPSTSAASSTSTSRGRRVKSGASQKTTGRERAYRRMPDPDTIMKAYRKVGTVSGLADRFNVPRHTVTHWARRLRSQGYNIGRSH